MLIEPPSADFNLASIMLRNDDARSSENEGFGFLNAFERRNVVVDGAPDDGAVDHHGVSIDLNIIELASVGQTHQKHRGYDEGSEDKRRQDAFVIGLIQSEETKQSNDP